MWPYTNWFASIIYRLERIECEQTSLVRESEIHWRKIMSALDDLQQEVTNNTSVTQSAIALLGALKKDLDEAIADNDMDKVKAIRDSLADNDTALASAIVANTPGATMTDPLPPGNATGPSTPQNPSGAVQETKPGSANPVTPASQHAGVLKSQPLA